MLPRFGFVAGMTISVMVALLIWAAYVSVLAFRRGIEYPGNALPRLPLDQCTSDQRECTYQPVGSNKLRWMLATGMLRLKP
jgi:hypothetical protein